MTIERRRPLPPGRYWADVFPKNRIYFNAWVKNAGDSGALHGEVSERIEGVDGAPEHDFVIFTTNRELVWPDADMGFAPNVAPASVHTSDDTVTKPDVPSGLDQLEDFGKGLSNAVGSVIAVTVGAVVFVALLAAFKRK